MKYLVKPEFLTGKKVRVYRNLQRDCWSVLYQNRVIYHAQTLELKNVSFKVRQSGYQRFLVEQRKNVHAFVCGEVVSVDFAYPTKGWTQVKYDPRVSNLFHTVKPIFKGRAYYFSDQEELKRAVFQSRRLYCRGRNE